MGGDLASFERFMQGVPKSTWREVPDSGDEGSLYAGRISAIATIVRVYQGPTGITRQKLEVALPTETSDEFALAILTRFVAEYVGHPQELRSVMDTLRAMRKTILSSGKRSVRMPYRKAIINLSLDSSTAEFNPKTIEVPWGMLYWKVEIAPMPQPKVKR